MPSLRPSYNCFGDFYQWTIYMCRRSLDIVLKGSSATDPDFMVVMMNPGSSHPEDGHPTHGIVPTVPDRTQNQIMALMQHAGFEYARILNLSDICEAKSSNFRKTLAELGTNKGHSIFDATRKNDLQSLFVTGVPVLAAWGVHSDLRDYAELALASLKAADVRSVKRNDMPWAARHPLPRIQADRVKWLNDAKALFQVDSNP